MIRFFSVFFTLFLTVSTISFAQTAVDLVCFGSSSEDYSIDETIGSTYSWSVSGGGVITSPTSTGLSITVDWSSVTTIGLITNAITLTETNASNCSADAFLNVDIVASPTLNVSALNSTICIGDDIVLTATSGYDTYDWTPTSVSLTNTGTYTPSGLLDNNFSVVATNSDGCTSTGSVSIVINDLPNVTASIDDSEICLGDDVNLSATAGFVSYAWTNNVITGESGTYTPVLSDNNFSVEVTDANGCISSDDVALVVNDSPTLNLTVDGANTTTICLEESITLLATSTASTFVWSPLGVVTNAGGVYTPLTTSETTYSVTATDASSGCEATELVNITINNIPNPGPINFNN
jgi:hypothetical protein